MTAKGYRTLGFLKRNLRVNSPTLKAKAYASILRLQLKYGSTVWDSRKGVENSGSYNLEMEQRRAARWALGRYQQLASVTELLTELNWRTLEQRRVDAHLTMLYRIFNKLVAMNPGDDLRSSTRKSSYVHDHSFIPIPSSATSHRLSFFHLPTSTCLISPLILLSPGPVCQEYSSTVGVILDTLLLN